MKRSLLTAVMRVYDTGQERLAAYYLDVFNDQHLIGTWPREEVEQMSDAFAIEHGFEQIDVEIVQLRAGSSF